MPLLKSSENELLPFVEKSDKILKEYLENKDKLYKLETDACKGWIVSCPYLYQETEDLKYYPSIQEILKKKNNFNIVMLMVSDIVSNLPEGKHREELPEGVRRFHVPLKNNETARLNILDGNDFVKYKWEEKQLFEFVNPDTIHYITCESGDNRIVLMVDGYFGEYNETIEKESKQFYSQWIDSVGYHRV